MMPSSEHLFAYQSLLGAVFCAKLVHILDLLYCQTQQDIFFIDWEQPHTSVSGNPTVSVWRSVFVANEWVKIQTERSTSIELTLFFLIFLLEGVGVQSFATLIPGSKGDPGIPPHMLLRFALSTFLIMIIAFGQWLIRWVFWDRFIKDRVWQFVDLLTVTNISCLLLEERFYGYYLHGRSVHAHAEADMLQLNLNLKREEDGLVAKRGLKPESDVQTFLVYLARGVRDKYDSAFAGGGGYHMPQSRKVDRRTGRRRGFQASPEDALRRHSDVNAFLIDFVSNNLDRNKIEVRPKLYIEKLLGMPPEMTDNSSTSLFLEDPDGGFKKVLLAGHEYNLTLLNILTYGLFDMIYTNTFVSIFATYGIDLLFRLLRNELSLRNISFKTLIDSRFLL